jgi:hypothetical protein
MLWICNPIEKSQSRIRKAAIAFCPRKSFELTIACNSTYHFRQWPLRPNLSVRPSLTTASSRSWAAALTDWIIERFTAPQIQLRSPRQAVDSCSMKPLSHFENFACPAMLAPRVSCHRNIPGFMRLMINATTLQHLTMALSANSLTVPCPPSPSFAHMQSP